MLCKPRVHEAFQGGVFMSNWSKGCSVCDLPLPAWWGGNRVVQAPQSSGFWFQPVWCLHTGLVTQLCPTLCYPMDCSMPSFPILQHLPEFAQTHVCWVGDAIQPCYSYTCAQPAVTILHLGGGLHSILDAVTSKVVSQPRVSTKKKQKQKQKTCHKEMAQKTSPVVVMMSRS